MDVEEWKLKKSTTKKMRRVDEIGAGDRNENETNHTAAAAFQRLNSKRRILCCLLCNGYRRDRYTG